MKFLNCFSDTSFMKILNYLILVTLMFSSSPVKAKEWQVGLRSLYTDFWSKKKGQCKLYMTKEDKFYEYEHDLMSPKAELEGGKLKVRFELTDPNYRLGWGGGLIRKSATSILLFVPKDTEVKLESATQVVWERVGTSKKQERKFNPKSMTGEVTDFISETSLDELVGGPLSTVAGISVELEKSGRENIARENIGERLQEYKCIEIKPPKSLWKNRDAGLELVFNTNLQDLDESLLLVNTTLRPHFDAAHGVVFGLIPDPVGIGVYSAFYELKSPEKVYLDKAKSCFKGDSDLEEKTVQLLEASELYKKALDEAEEENTKETISASFKTHYLGLMQDYTEIGITLYERGKYKEAKKLAKLLKNGLSQGTEDEEIKRLICALDLLDKKSSNAIYKKELAVRRVREAEARRMRELARLEEEGRQKQYEQELARQRAAEERLAETRRQEELEKQEKLARVEKTRRKEKTKVKKKESSFWEDIGKLAGLVAVGYLTYKELEEGSSSGSSGYSSKSHSTSSRKTQTPYPATRIFVHIVRKNGKEIGLTYYEIVDLKAKQSRWMPKPDPNNIYDKKGRREYEYYKTHYHIASDREYEWYRTHHK